MVNITFAKAMAEVGFNDLKKHDLLADDIRFCLAYPDLALHLFYVETKIFWLLYFINVSFF